jgi:type VI secretion system secreted protein Hcp
MAETVHLFLKANGEDVQGNSTQTSLGRENSIECIYYEQAVSTAREKGTGLATGRRRHEPISITKRVDKSTPRIAKALCNNEVIEGKFLFFRPSPGGDGTTEQFYTVEITEGRVFSQKIISPNSIDPAASNDPVLETVEFVFHTITWQYVPDSIEHLDNWREGT